MNQEKLFHMKSPSIQPLFCAIPHGQNLSQFIDRGAYEIRSVETTTIDRHGLGKKTITNETITDFLSLSRQYLGLDSNP